MGKTKLILTPHDDGLELSREEFVEADVEEPWRYERVLSPQDVYTSPLLPGLEIPLAGVL